MDFISIANDDEQSMDVFYYMDKLQSASDCDSVCLHFVLASNKPELDESKPNIRKLQFDVHIARAEQKLKALCAAMRAKWDIANIVLVHRIGYVFPGAVFAIVGVAGRNSQDMSAAVTHALSEISKLPIWREETYEDDSRCWTSTHECFWRLNAEEREGIDKTLQGACHHGAKQLSKINDVIKQSINHAHGAKEDPGRPKPCSDPNCINRH